MSLVAGVDAVSLAERLNRTLTLGKDQHVWDATFVTNCTCLSHRPSDCESECEIEIRSQEAVSAMAAASTYTNSVLNSFDSPLHQCHSSTCRT